MAVAVAVDVDVAAAPPSLTIVMPNQPPSVCLSHRTPAVFIILIVILSPVRQVRQYLSDKRKYVSFISRPLRFITVISRFPSLSQIKYAKAVY